MKIDSIVDLFHSVIEAPGRPDLLNYKENGSWQSVSTAAFGDTVQELALGLQSLGVRKNDTVGIISNSTPQWIMSDLAIMLRGGITVPIFRRISPENLKFEIEGSGMRFIFIGDAAEYEPVRAEGKSLEKIITIGFKRDDPIAIGFEELVSLGSSLMKSGDESVPLFPKPREDDLATIIYTSGSMGVPKGVMLSHKNIISQVKSAAVIFDVEKDRDIALTSLPLSHIFERMVMYFYLSRGIPIYFVDDLGNIGGIIREIRPTIMTVVPRLLEKIFDKMRMKVEEEKGLKKLIASAAFERAETKVPDEPFKGVRDSIYRKLVYSKFAAALGGRFRYVITGAAPLSNDLNRFFLNIGVPLFEGYGLTEASPVVSANFPGNRRMGTVGKVFPGVSVEFADDGEILVTGPNVMKGYHKNPEETAAALDGKGRLHTGDLGKLDADGYLLISGRKKELFKKSTGEYVPPVPIEQAVSKLDIVDTAVVVADNRSFVSCLIFPNMEAVERRRVKDGFESVPIDQFVDGPQVRKLIEEHIKEINKHLHHTEEVQKFAIIKSPISIETGELTPTMKIRRHVIYEKFKAEIDALYE